MLPLYFSGSSLVIYGTGVICYHLFVPLSIYARAILCKLQYMKFTLKQVSPEGVTVIKSASDEGTYH